MTTTNTTNGASRLDVDAVLRNLPENHDDGLWIREEHTSELEKLQRLCDSARRALHRAKQVGDEDRAAAIRKENEPVFAAFWHVKRRDSFAKICPVDWTHAATEDQIEASICHDGLKKFAAQADLIDRSALLHGPTAVGKTTALALAIRRYVFSKPKGRDAIGRPCLRLKSIVWTYSRALSAAARQHPLGEGEAPLLTKARNAGLLVLDDLGLERDLGEVLDVVHDRYEKSKPTWTTSGFTYPELSQRYGEFFTRRLHDGQSRPGVIVDAFSKGAG